MKSFLRILFICFLFIFNSTAHATHNRAGEISYKHIGGYKWEVTVTTYTKYSSFAADRDSLLIDWGDGTADVIARTDTTFMGNDIKRNTYKNTHTYPGPSLYIMSVEDPNRNSDVLNIPNSVNVSFYLETVLNFADPQVFGINNSPQLLNPPIDFANVNQTYIHNPAAFDPDGDSLAYTLIDCKGNAGQNIAGYVLPDQISPGANNTMSMDPVLGDFIWNAPQQKGEYNIAILIKEYRNGMLIGSMIRDMQIIVLDNQNDPPEIQDLNDTCIVAGSTLNINVSATDPNTGQYITLQGQGGPLEYGSNPASFALTSSQGLVSSNFIWNTGCNDIRRHFYSVIFKAEDDFSFGFTKQHLVDLKTWRIWVVAPPPKNLIATPYMNNIRLEWDSLYDCASASHFKGFSLWRKEGSNAFDIDSCETGLSGKGYYKIADKLNTYFYNDLDLNRGKSYCYRILAHFHLGSDQFPYNETESLPSNEACAELMQDIPLITKTSVQETSSSLGKINLSWTKPIADDLDTIQNSGPYNYEIYRGIGLNPNSFSLIHSITDMNYYSFNDTSYLDSNLNTIDNAYTYYIRFNSNSILIGDAPTSSSIFLGIGETDNTLNLSWDENTAWINSEYHIYRKNTLGIFDSIGVSNNKSYSDTGLANGDEYCYKVKSSGAYSDTNIYKPLINWSQESCGIPIDTIPPCPPEISVYNYCEDIPDDIWQSHYYYNLVSWPAMSETCADDIVQYNIYYKANQFLNYAFVSNLSDKNDTSFIHNGLIESVAGCYYVTAIDSYYNESPMSNEVCVDNCPVYDLPNIFTPNGDKANDIFTPFIPFRFIDHIELKVYNRWGNQVFETKDAEINWNGYNLSSGKRLQSGVYFYTCELYEKRITGVVKNENTLKGWIEIIY